MKNLARLFALALIVVMTLSLVACGGPSSKIQGEWKGKIGGLLPITMEFDGDEVTVSAMGESETLDFEIDDETLTIDGDESDYEFEDDDTLILEIEGEEVELERQ